MDIMVMGESRGINGFADATSRLGSIVQINSIAIDISGSMEAMESPVHEHFSIRGFVAGMRNKDQKTCFPFASEGNDVDLVDFLPPLYVPEFRWWQCSSCIPKDARTRTTEEIVVATKGDANTSSFENVGAKEDFFIHRRENTEKADNDQSNINKTPKLCCSERHKDITCSKGKIEISDIKAGNSRDMPEVNQQQVIESLDNTTDATDMVCLADQPVCEVEPPDNASSGSDGTFSVLPHRRKPKLRYLADILVEGRNQTSSNPRTRSSSSCGMQAESTDMEAVLVPHVDVHSDVGKASQSPERKRKIALEEDREALAATFPRAAPKRVKGLVLDSEKIPSRVTVSDPESKGGAAMRLDMPRPQRIKPKKAKAIDANKKMKQTRRDDEIAQIREYLLPNNVSSTNLKEQVVPVETNLGKLGSAPSILVEMGRGPHGFRSSLSGQQMEKVSDRSMAKTPDQVGADDEPLLPPRKSILRNCNTRETMALDLSLNSFMDADGNHNDQASVKEHRRIPDLNVEYPGKTALTEEQQSTTLSEKRSLPQQKAMDASASSSHGPSDDIPMEIVELLAKNQHERALGNSRRHMLGVDDTMKGYSATVLGERPCTTSFPLPGRINGGKVANGNMGIRPNKCQMDMSKPEKNHFRFLSSSTPSQLPKPEYSTSVSIMAGPTSSTWEDLIVSYARLPAPFHLSIPQNHPIQTTGMSSHSFLDESHKGKTVGEIKDGKGKKAVADVVKLKDGRIRSNCTSLGSLDPYSNDTIPAMQLLSLMDQRVKSGTSYEVGTKSSQDKPFSPCKHHPRLTGKKNRNILRGPFFPQNSSSKDLSMLRYGVYSSGETSFRAPSNLREVRNSKTTPLEGSSDLERRTERTHVVFGDCTLNKNPADFSIPEVGNEFTISSKDLRRRKRHAFGEKLRTRNVDGRKRQRMRKHDSERESPR